MGNDVLAAQERAARGPVPGSRWRHYKGREYHVIICAVVEATMEVVVVYRCTDSVWTRPLSQWEELVEVNGLRVPRFSRG